MQEQLSTDDGQPFSITLHTAQRWMHKMDWRYEKRMKGMYIDGHERDDVVKYRQEFCARWKEYEKCMVTYDNNSNIDSIPAGFPVPGGRFRIQLVTHDESTFAADDRCKTIWQHSSHATNPEQKGEGTSIMVSDFLSLEWGRLKTDERCTYRVYATSHIISKLNSEARVIFHLGKNQEGYFTAEDLLAQVDRAIDIFEELTRGFTIALFIFDNVPSHKKRAPDALSARKMVKTPTLGWTPVKGGPRMRCGQLLDGTAQDFYYPDDHPTMPGWFKGMKAIIKE